MTNSNDASPVWEDRTVYFLSDRNGAVSLFSYDTETKAVTDVLNNKGYDLKSVAAGPGALVYEQFGSLHLYDLASHQQHTVPVTIHGDLPSLVPHLAHIPARELQAVGISPTGARLVVEAHGDIFTLPAEKGDTRNLTKHSRHRRARPRLVPRRQIHRLLQRCLRRIPALSSATRTACSLPRSSTSAPTLPTTTARTWSPDSKRIAFTDKHLHLWYVDVANGKPVKVDTGLRGSFGSA